MPVGEPNNIEKQQYPPYRYPRTEGHRCFSDRTICSIVLRVGTDHSPDADTRHPDAVHIVLRPKAVLDPPVHIRRDAAS
ncbi:hypothetical protein G647_07978 [Cladophialophora carrionii CBS 160.54]|uniref:Uncharacterized protein n=1 Tax=Cladophialophora carrionii CBS 160.54 TaxID=1279043 RepID=V9D4N9_9EURO|nr:uncharacterized protein G647_07978 [Cladophialophora carrionii CBS 160.54]ETI21631.1 hypothetical protein G647_07978 [Cladophialophora carrionii CBS 160.54]